MMYLSIWHHFMQYRGSSVYDGLDLRRFVDTTLEILYSSYVDCVVSTNVAVENGVHYTTSMYWGSHQWLRAENSARSLSSRHYTF